MSVIHDFECKSCNGKHAIAIDGTPRVDCKYRYICPVTNKETDFWGTAAWVDAPAPLRQ